MRPAAFMDEVIHSIAATHAAGWVTLLQVCEAAVAGYARSKSLG
jgi:hypothetical protein